MTLSQISTWGLAFAFQPPSLASFWLGCAPLHGRHTAALAFPSLGPATETEIGMSISGSGDSNASVPAWALRAADPAPTSFTMSANQPLVPAVDLTGVKKQIRQELKEIRLAVDGISRLTRKRGQDTGRQALNLSDQVRRGARSTTAKIRDAMNKTTEESADYLALTKMGEDLKSMLQDFQKNVELATASDEASPSGSCAPLVMVSSQSVAVQIEEDIAHGEEHDGDRQQQVMQQELASHEQLRAVQTNDAILADRDVGIDGIARSVQELQEIFQVCTNWICAS